MEDMTCKVYVLPDDAGRITAINSGAFLPDTAGWVLIDEGWGDRYHHAQGNYLDKPIADERGVLRYKLVGGVVEERTQAEMEAEYTPPTPAAGSDAERIAELEEETRQIKQALIALTGGLTNA